MNYIITGGSEGLGLELCRLLHEKGETAVSLSRKPPPDSSEHIKVNLTEEEEIEKAAEIIKRKYPKFKAIINCAGILHLHKPESIKYNEAEYLFKLNVLAPMILTSRIHKLILKNEADIVNVASTIGTKAYSEQAAYGASKWAMRGLTKNQQLEFHGTKTRVIGFNPGGFKSRIFEKATGRKINLDGFMEPKELAKTILFILDLPKDMEVSEITINRKV